MRTTPHSHVLGTTVLLGFLIFLPDLVLPALHLWPLYFLVLVLVYRWGTVRTIYLAVALFSVFIVVSGVVRLPLSAAEIFNDHILPLLLIWPAAWLLAGRQQAVAELARNEAELETQVQKRTAELQQEIAARRETEIALRESEQRYRILSENARDVVWTTDLAGNPTYFSPSVAQMSGFGRNETLQFTWEERLATGIDPNVRPHLQEIIAAVQAGDPLGAEPIVAPQRRQDGTIIWTETLISPLYDDTGVLQGVLGATRDITRRYLAEDALRRSQERLDKIFRSSPSGIALVRQDGGQYLEANQAYLEMVGYTLEQVLGHTSAELGILTPTHREQLAAHLLQYGYVRGLDTQIVNAAGQTVDVLYSAEQIDIDGEPCYLLLTFNISRRKHMERQLQRVNQELEERVNLRTAALQEALDDLQRASQLKDEFLAMISHELRTPISGVLNLAETLAEEIVGPLNARQAQYVAGIGESGRRLLAVVDGILSYTHLVAGKVVLKPAPCCLQEALAACVAQYNAAAAARHHTLSLTVMPPDLTIVCDQNGLAAVITRLLDNALKFTPPGGCIGVEATSAPSTGEREGSAAAEVQITIWDTGPGIAPSQLVDLVKPLVQADGRLARRHEGMGMGLAYVYQMLLLMGGNVEVWSKEGSGSRFAVTLPAHSPTPPA